MSTKEYSKLKPGDIVYKFDPAVRFRIPGVVVSKQHLLIRATFGPTVEEFWFTELFTTRGKDIQL